MELFARKKKQPLGVLYQNCFVCQESSNGRLCLARRDFRNMKTCRLFQLMRARRPLCTTCRIILEKSANNLRRQTQIFFPRYFWRRIDRFEFCLICGRRSLLLTLEIGAESIRTFILRELIHQDIKIQTDEDVCCYCSVIISDLVIFFAREMEERALAISRSSGNPTALPSTSHM